MQATSANTLSCSRLWGSAGELWNPESRLPDFSWAGYHCGDDPLPQLPRGVSVKEFGAVGDGNHDDTDAFLKAIAEAQGAIEIPAGRYVISKILEITRSNVVLRGEGPDKSVLVCPVHLSDIRPDWGATTTGERTSNYSWSGGILWLKGSLPSTSLTSIQGQHKRGSQFIDVSSSGPLSLNQRILIRQTDTPDNSLAAWLYSDDPGETRELKGTTTARMACRIVSISGNRVEIDRPLRFDLKPDWKPELLAYNPTVTESGAENLGFEFPQTGYQGHFKELGHNAIALENVSDCWIKNIRIHNADSGVFGFGSFCSVVDVKFTCSRAADAVSGCTGHHGVYFHGDDNLFSRFSYDTTFIHDISISVGSGNVFSDGKGVDLCFDHHKRAPYENLFTHIDMGRGTRPWMCGGGCSLGKHCAARGTFWNLLSEEPIPYPPNHFGPASMNLVGVNTSDSRTEDPQGKWLEPSEGGAVEPENLHLAQLKKRRADRNQRS